MEKNVPEEHWTTFLSIIDKIERARPEDTAEKLSKTGVTLEEVRGFMASVDGGHPIFASLRADLEARGLWKYVRIDATIVRGLAYYTGMVFEVFDLKHGLRAVAGGGRYDKLCALISDGGVDMPSAGFAMGDVVLGILLSKTPGAQMGITEYLNAQMGVEAYVVVADEAQRGPALAAVQALRSAGVKVDLSMSAQKVGKQFQAAENQKARFALVFGAEYPQVQLKNLVSREQTMVAADALVATLQEALKLPVMGPLIA
jgi:histidyl-tRNA synthetase